MSDRSADARDISQSVVVTGDGNNVAFTFGDTGIRLRLRRKQFPPPDRHRRPRPEEPPRMTSPNQLPIISRFRQINSRFGQINSQFRLTGIGVQAIDRKRYF